MSEMTATRTTLGIMAAAAWLGAAWFLWRTSVPAGLVLPDVPLGAAPSDVERARAYAGTARLLVLGGLLAPLAAVGAVTAVAPRLVGAFRAPRLVRSLWSLGVVLVAAWAAAVPFRLALHRRRRRYGLAEQTDAEWLLAPWLETLATAAAAAVALVLAIWLARRAGRRWWVVASPVLAGLGAVVVFAQPLVLAPRLEPLRDEALAADVGRLAAKAGIEDVRVDVKRATPRTTALNAEVAGLGPTRRVVLWDTLLGGRVPQAEIRYLVAHELAHEERSHLLKGLAWFALVSPLLTLLVAGASRRRGGITEPAAVPLAVLALLVAELALLPAANVVSRRYEAEADWRALRLTSDPTAAQALLRRFVRENVSDPAPPLWSRVLLGTHPTLPRRAAMFAAWRARSRGAASPAGP